MQTLTAKILATGLLLAAATIVLRLKDRPENLKRVRLGLAIVLAGLGIYLAFQPPAKTSTDDAIVREEVKP